MTTEDKIAAWLEAGRGGYSQEELEAAFNKVKNTEHWKNPVDAVIDAADMRVVSFAIPWFTSTQAIFETLGDGKLRVTADGYWSVEGLC